MNDNSSKIKAAKKAAKAELKALKKQAKVEAVTPAEKTSVEQTTGRTPAERSAAAAEKQVRLQRFRVLIGILAVLVGLATLLVTVKPWRWNSNSDAQQEPPNAAETAAPEKSPAGDEK